MSDIARAQWSTPGHGNAAIVTEWWRVKPSYGRNALAVQLTGTNWGSVAELLESRGVHVNTTTAPVRLHFGGERGCYSMAPGDWIAIYGDSDQRGAEGWADSDWKRIWEPAPEADTRKIAEDLMALGQGDLRAVIDALSPGHKASLRKFLGARR